jgi:hypothetical protein
METRFKVLSLRALIVIKLLLLVAGCTDVSRDKNVIHVANKLTEKESICLSIIRDSSYKISNNHVYKITGSISEHIDTTDCIDTFEGRVKLNARFNYSYLDNELILFDYKNDQNYIVRGNRLFSSYKTSSLLDSSLTIALDYNGYSFGSNFMKLYPVKLVSNSNWDFLKGFLIHIKCPDPNIHEKLMHELDKVRGTNRYSQGFNISGDLYYIKSDEKPKSVGEQIYEGFELQLRSFTID